MDKILLLILLLIMTSCGQVSNKSEESLLLEAKSYLNEKDWDKAINSFEYLYNKYEREEYKEYLGYSFVGCSGFNINKLEYISKNINKSNGLIDYLNQSNLFLSTKSKDCLNKAIELYPEDQEKINFRWTLLRLFRLFVNSQSFSSILDNKIVSEEGKQITVKEFIKISTSSINFFLEDLYISNYYLKNSYQDLEIYSNDLEFMIQSFLDILDLIYSKEMFYFKYESFRSQIIQKNEHVKSYLFLDFFSKFNNDSVIKSDSLVFILNEIDNISSPEYNNYKIEAKSEINGLINSNDVINLNAIKINILELSLFDFYTIYGKIKKYEGIVYISDFI